MTIILIMQYFKIFILFLEHVLDWQELKKKIVLDQPVTTSIKLIIYIF